MSPPPVGSHVRVNGDLARVVAHLSADGDGGGGGGGGLKSHFKAILMDDVGSDILSDAMGELVIEIDYVHPSFTPLRPFYDYL